MWRPWSVLLICTVAVVALLHSRSVVYPSRIAVRTLTEITLPRATRTNPQTTGWAWVQLATLYRFLS